MIAFVFDFGLEIHSNIVEKHLQREARQASACIPDGEGRCPWLSGVICSRSGVLRSGEVRRPGGELRS